MNKELIQRGDIDARKLPSVDETPAAPLAEPTAMNVDRVVSADESQIEADEAEQIKKIRDTITLGQTITPTPVDPKTPKKYKDLAGVPTQEMVAEQTIKDAKAYISENSIYPKSRIELLGRIIDLIVPKKYRGIKGEGARANFDKFPPAQAVEFTTNGYKIEYKTEELPPDLTAFLKELARKVTEAGYKDKFQFNEGSRLLTEFDISSGSDGESLNVPSLNDRLPIIVVPGSRKDLRSNTYYNPEVPYIVVTGDVRDPQFLVSLMHEVGHSVGDKDQGDRAKLKSADGIETIEAARILRSEKNASNFALNALGPFIDEGENRRLLDKKQTCQNLETCLYTYSERLFFLRAIARMRKENAPPEPASISREHYYLPIEALVSNGDDFAFLSEKYPEDASQYLLDYCRMMHFDIYGFAQDQASDQKVEIGDLDTPEGRLLRREREIVLDVEKRSDPLGTEEIIKLIHELTELARALNY